MKLSTRLLRWYDKEGRDLPWRRTKNPYRILVSEVMLQQTQVDRVKVFYHAWLKQFPTWKKLAEAGNAEVIRAWAGLGYNRRALALRDISRIVVKQGLPQTEEEWLKLKGVGPYTASAVSILAQNKKTLPIDTNIRRILGRLLLGKPYPQVVSHLPFRAKGSRLLKETDRHADLVQALFDLASSHCGKVPTCATCPLKNKCPAGAKFLSGKVKRIERITPMTYERRHREKPHPDRIYRGRILKLVREASSGVEVKALGSQIDPDFLDAQDRRWLEAMLERLVKDDLVARRRGRLYLP